MTDDIKGIQVASYLYLFSQCLEKYALQGQFFYNYLLFFCMVPPL